MFWSRGMKAGSKPAFVSRMCLLQFSSKSTQIWQSCQAFNDLGSCIFSSKELDFSGAWQSLPKESRPRPRTGGWSTAGWKVKIHIPCAAHFLRAFRGWQALVLGTLHLCAGLFLPEQSWGLSNLNVDERSGREGNPRAEAWSLVGKVKDWEGGRKGAKREWALVRSWQRAKALDRGQKSEGWGREKRLEHGGVRLWIKAHRFEGVRAAWGGEQRQELGWSRWGFCYSLAVNFICASSRLNGLNKNDKCQDKVCPQNWNIPAFDHVPFPVSAHSL